MGLYNLNLNHANYSCSVNFTMIIIQEKLGMQLANRLFLFSHFIANAIENEYILINPTFDEYCQYFYATRDNNFGKYPIYTKFRINPPFILFKILVRLTEKIFSISKYHEFIQCPKTGELDLSDINFLSKVKHKNILANGWLFRDKKSFRKHSNVIRSYFTPDQEILHTIDQLISDCKDKCDVLIGIHLRRGDFKLYQNAKFYFHDDVYIDKMEQIQTHFNSTGKRVLFLICSNEPIQEHNFKKYNIRLGMNKLIEDLYSLAKCDYLIGPPSTYSMWASFYGKVPLLNINNQSQTVKLEDFCIVDG